MKRKRQQAGLKQGGRAGNRKKRRIVRPPPRPRNVINRRTGGFLGIQTKFFDTALTATAITSPADATGGELDPNYDVDLGAVALLCLGAPPPGNDESSRIGDEIRVQQIDINGTITCAAQANQTATDIGTKVFLALVLDTQTNAAQLNSEDVYTNPSASATLAASPFRDMQRTKRFKTIRTQEFIFENPSMSWDGTNIEQNGLAQHFRWVIPTDIVYQFVGSGRTVASLSSNSLHVIGYTSSTALVPTLQYNCRQRFSDVPR